MTGPPSSSPGPPTSVVPGVGWVDVISRAVTQVGFPIVIAGVLLWFLLTRFEGTMAVITDRMTKNMDTAGRLADAIMAQMPELQRQTVELTRQSDELRQQTALLQQIAHDASDLLAVRRGRGPEK